MENRTQQILKEISQYMNDDVGILDALTHYANKHDVEVEVLGEIVRKSPTMMARATLEAEKMRLIEATHRLPI